MKHRNRNILTWCAALLLCSVAPALGVYGGPGLHETTLYAGQTIDAGTVSVWNSPKKLMVQVDTSAGSWRLADVHIYVGYPDVDPIPTTKKGNIKIDQLPYVKEYPSPAMKHTLTLDLQEDLGFSWGSQYDDLRQPTFLVHAHAVKLDEYGEILAEEGAWAYGADLEANHWGWYFTYLLAHPKRGQFIDSPVQGLSYLGPTQEGSTGPDEDNENGGFLFFPGETLDFSIGPVPLGRALGGKKVSPLDLFSGVGVDQYPVLGVARTLQSLDNDQSDGKIVIAPEVAECFGEVVFEAVGSYEVFWEDPYEIDMLLDLAVGGVYDDSDPTAGACDFVTHDNDGLPADLMAVSDAEAQANLEAGLNASGVFRKNVTKTPEWGEGKQKLDVMPVYFPGMRSNGEPSLCIDVNEDGIYDEGEDTLGVPYEEWRLGGDPAAEECDPRDFEDAEACTVTLIECREIAKPIVTAFTQNIDIFDENTTTEFWEGRFSNDIVASISRDDGTTWKRMNVSRMADLSSFDLETGEPFPGTCHSPQMKVNDNQILMVWASKFCKSGNPRYAINVCDEFDHDTDGDGIPDSCLICRETADETICEPDYTSDDPYAVTDIWGVRGQQRSVDYDEVDDVADLGIGEIPYSCLWAARGVIASAKDIADGVFASMTVLDDPETEEDESDAVEVGDIVWYKPERLTSGRRDAYIPVIGSARGAGFAIAWQEDPEGLRPGKGKGPGQGWSGAISNHKTDIWYSFISYADFSLVDGDFVPGGPGDDPNEDGGGYEDKPGLGRPKALVPFSLPVRITDNDMVNTHTLKVESSSNCVTPPNGTEEVCFPDVDTLTGTFVPLDSDEIAIQFCDHPEADPATCCDPENHQDDPNCEDLKGLYGNLTGTKRYAYLAKSIDDDGDGVADFQYYEDRGGTLDLCDTSGDNAYMDELPGSSAHERWYGFTNVEGSSKLVCVTSDGRLLDGDVSASRPNIQLQPYTKGDGSKSAWVLLAYEESKGMGHSLAAAEHDEDQGDELINDDPGQDKPIKQDLGKNVIYHSFDYAQPDLVAPGHIINLPALCGGLYPTYCDDADNPTCTCEPGQPVPLYFDYPNEVGEWIPDPTKFLQFRTEIARRTRFIAQSPGKMGATKTLGTIIYKQGQEGQGRPADVFIRRIVKPQGDTGNPYKFDNFQCTTYLDQSFSLPACPNGAGGMDSAMGYNCNVWGEAYGDRLCGGIFSDPDGGFQRRDHINLTSADIDLSVDAGPEDDTPDDPTDDIYGTDKVLLWSQHPYNLGDESYGHYSGVDGFSGMFSNARSHRGFIRGDFLATAYAFSPNWAAGRNGNDRYNFYVRKSFDGGKTWTTTPAVEGGDGIYHCREWRSDPTVPDDDGSGNSPPVYEGFDPECDPCAEVDELGQCVPTESAEFIGAGMFEPARNVSEIPNNKETSSDPRVGATPPTYPLDGTDPGMPILRFVEDEYVDNVFFVAWGTGDNVKSTGGQTVTPEAAPLDVYYTRTEDYGDTYLKVPWLVNGENSNFFGETVWRYERLAWGEEEQGECQLRATSDGSKMYGIYHQLTPVEGDPDDPITRWYPWEPEESHDNDIWFRRVIFWPTEEEVTP